MYMKISYKQYSEEFQRKTNNYEDEYSDDELNYTGSIYGMDKNTGEGSCYNELKFKTNLLDVFKQTLIEKYELNEEGFIKYISLDAKLEEKFIYNVLGVSLFTVSDYEYLMKNLNNFIKENKLTFDEFRDFLHLIDNLAVIEETDYEKDFYVVDCNEYITEHGYELTGAFGMFNERFDTMAGDEDFIGEADSSLYYNNSDANFIILDEERNDIQLEMKEEFIKNNDIVIEEELEL